MGPRGHGALLLLLPCLLFGTEGAGTKDCRKEQHGTKGCLHKHNESMHRGDNKKFILQYKTTEQISVSRCDPQTGKEETLLSGHPWNLHKHGNETRVFLINQTMTVSNVKRTNEGLYKISSYLYETCLEQVNLTVHDTPSSADTKYTSNVSISTGYTGSPSGSNGLYVSLVVPVAVVIILTAV